MSKLIFHLPAGGDRTVPLRPGEPLTIGRSDDNAVALPDGTLSRHHARLTWRDGTVPLFEDLQSANGTTLNATPLTRPEPLQDGDRLQFGEVTAVFRSTDADAARAPIAEPAVGDTFADRYRIEKSLGETFEFHNYQAADPILAKNVSLKIFRPEVVAQAGGFDRGAEEFARARHAPTHPGLIQLLDFGRWRGRTYLAAEWIEGYPLLDLLRRHGALDVRDAMLLARQAAAAADHARAHRLPAFELHLRSTLFAFDPPLAAADWERLLDTPLARWPAFALKLAPRLFAPAETVSAPVLPSLCTLVYELLGHAPTSSGAGRPKRIASLGEQGNEVLTRAAGSAAAFETGVAFIDALAQAAGVMVPVESRTPTLMGVSLRPPLTGLPPELLVLTEQIAARVHEFLADRRRRDGWTYGPLHDEAKKEHPHLVPYDQLPPGEKQYDRDVALGTVRALLALGCFIQPPPPPPPQAQQITRRV